VSTQPTELIQQHLIDPEICIRCNTCEAICPVGAITHDSRNYVVDAEKCNSCMACIGPCPTGSIDNWRTMLRSQAYSPEVQLLWDELPAELPPEQLVADDAAEATPAPQAQAVATPNALATAAPAVHQSVGSTLPPWSAAHAYTQLYGPKAAQKSIRATVSGNVRVTAVGRDYDTHHIVLDFGKMPFPVLEGQSIGILPPGVDANGRAHHARQYSISSPRNGERPGYNNLSLTVKRVLEDSHGTPVRGVASNYLCDLAVGDTVDVIGPFGASFLMPNHPRSKIVMICTGTGSAPMRAMTEWRRRLRASGKFDGGRLMLFFGARTQEELPYFGPLQNLPKDFIDSNFAFSRASGQPKRYVQDLIRERAADVAPLLADPDCYFYVCGLKSMEEGVVLALREVAQNAGLDWANVAADLQRQGRLHLETY
jgi:benzoyl-CoA 2,3-dioxygenase component A